MRNPPASASPWSPEEEDTVSVVRKPDTCQTLVFKSSEETNCHTSCITACGSALSAGPTKDWFEVEKCDTQMQFFVPCRQRLASFSVSRVSGVSPWSGQSRG